MTYFDTEKNVSALVHIRPEQANSFKKKLTDKQWSVYFYLLSISHYSVKKQEDHRYVYKEDINVTKAAAQLNISRRTFYTSLDALKREHLIRINEDDYSINIPESFTMINRKLLSQLLAYNNILGIDLLRVYLFCKIIYYKYSKKEFTRRSLIKALGHNDNTTERYKSLDVIFPVLKDWKLIDYTTRIEETQTGPCRLYKIREVYDNSTYLDELFNMNRIEEAEDAGQPLGLTKEEEEELYDMLHLEIEED